MNVSVLWSLITLALGSYPVLFLSARCSSCNSHLNSRPSHVTLPFKYRTPIVSRIQMNPDIGLSTHFFLWHITLHVLEQVETSKKFWDICLLCCSNLQFFLISCFEETLLSQSSMNRYNGNANTGSKYLTYKIWIHLTIITWPIQDDQMNKTKKFEHDRKIHTDKP